MCDYGSVLYIINVHKIILCHLSKVYYIKFETETMCVSCSIKTFKTIRVGK